VLAVPKTSAPAFDASWTAAVPTPPAAAWISTDSPSSRPPHSKRQAWAVRNWTGKPAASSKLIASGIGKSSCASTVVDSA